MMERPWSSELWSCAARRRGRRGLEGARKDRQPLERPPGWRATSDWTTVPTWGSALHEGTGGDASVVRKDRILQACFRAGSGARPQTASRAREKSDRIGAVGAALARDGRSRADCLA